MFQFLLVFAPYLLKFGNMPIDLVLLCQFVTYFTVLGLLTIPYLFLIENFPTTKLWLHLVKLHFTKKFRHFPLQVYVILTREFLKETPLLFLFLSFLRFLIHNSQRYFCNPKFASAPSWVIRLTFTATWEEISHFTRNLTFVILQFWSIWIDPAVLAHSIHLFLCGLFLRQYLLLPFTFLVPVNSCSIWQVSPLANDDQSLVIEARDLAILIRWSKLVGLSG